MSASLSLAGGVAGSASTVLSKVASADVVTVTQAGPQSGELLVAVALIGILFGAGAWIGWEVMRFISALMGAALGRTPKADSIGGNKPSRPLPAGPDTDAD